MSGNRHKVHRDGQRGFSPNKMPANKRPRVGSSSGGSSKLQYCRNDKAADIEDDDPFADDLITGEELEEWENIATQAEIRLTQQSADPSSMINGCPMNKVSNGGITYKATTKNKFQNAKCDEVLVKDLEKKLALYEAKVKELEQSYTRKDGETRILRDKLTRTEKELNQEKCKILEIQKKYAETEADREKHVQKEIEKYKDQVQFKHAEIIESQNLIRNLEAKNKMLIENKNLGKPKVLEAGSLESPGGCSSAKKIRLVKPESPRIPTLNNTARFSDEPLGRKKGVKLSPTKPSTSKASSAVKDDCEQKTSDDTSGIHPGMTLRSKYISKDVPGGATLHSLLTLHPKYSDTMEDVDSCNDSSPLLALLSSEKGQSKFCTVATAIEGARNLISAPQRHCSPFKPENNTTVCDHGGGTEFASLIESMLTDYMLLQDALVSNRSLALASSSRTVGSDADKLPATETPKYAIENSDSKCKNAHAALRVLEILAGHCCSVKRLILSKDSNILKCLLKLCESERWDSRLKYCDDIALCSLRILSIIGKVSKDEQHMVKFSSLVSNEILLPLITNGNIAVRSCALDAITSVIHCPKFAHTIVTDHKKSEAASILCHVCDLCCLGCAQNCDDGCWISLLFKAVNFLSALVCEHERLLVENSCFCEIYHASDILLYNQLLLWKKEAGSNPARVVLIKRAVCLLHSCANVYADGIPGSRRDHRHMVMLTELERFIAQHGDQTSFWSQELHRIAKSEVESIFEEIETT